MFITKENHKEVAEVLFSAVRNTTYNQECFGSKDVMHHMIADDRLCCMLDKYLEHNLNAIAIHDDLNKRYDLDYQFLDESLDTSTLLNYFPDDLEIDFTEFEDDYKHLYRYSDKYRREIKKEAPTI